MIHIAICDDNLSHTEEIESRLLRLQPLFQVKIVTSIFYSGENFCKAIEDSCPFEMVLMDIEMAGIDGIKAGEKLRANEENDFVLLFYISGHEDYYRQLFDVQPYGFIEKPINEQEFTMKLTNAIQKILRRRQDGIRRVLPVSRNGHELLIPLQTILYLESSIRKIRLFTTNEVIEYYGKLNKEEKKLPISSFVRTHQSYMVHLKYVKKFTIDSLTLVDNTEIPISSSRRKSFKEGYMDYRRNFF